MQVSLAGSCRPGTWCHLVVHGHRVMQEINCSELKQLRDTVSSRRKRERAEMRALGRWHIAEGGEMASCYAVSQKVPSAEKANEVGGSDLWSL